MRERILLVDDERDFCLTLKRALEKRGFDVETAFNGRSAIELARQRPFDLMIVDVRMPDISGLDALQAVKEFQPRVEGIVVTGYASYEAPVSAIKLGVRDYLGKPFGLDEFLAATERVLSQARAASRQARSASRQRRGYVESLKILAHEWEEATTGRSSPAPDVAALAIRLARRCGLSAEKARDLGDLAYLARLGRSEAGEAHTQAWLLARVLEPVQELHEFMPVLLALHERYDGAGGPEGLAGEDIPLGSRILACARILVEEGEATAREARGGVLDPEIVELAVSLPAGDSPQEADGEDAPLEDRYAALMRLAAAYQQAGDLPTALLALDEAGQAAAAAGDREMQAGCGMRRAFLCWEQGQAGEALRLAEEAVHWGHQAGGLTLAPLLADLGRLRALHGDRDAAEQALEASRTHYERWRLPYDAARVSLHLAALYDGWKNDESQRCLQRAVDLADAHGHPEVFTWEWSAAGPVLAHWLDRHPAAGPLMDRVLAIFNGIGPAALDLWPADRVPLRVRELPGMASALSAADNGRTAAAVPRLRIHCLGEFAVFHGPDRVKEEVWHGRKVKNLLALLLLHRGKPVSSEVIIEMFWPDSTEEKARHNLHMTVHRMRKSLEDPAAARGTHPPYVLQQADSYAFNLEAPHWLDVDAFEAKFVEGRAHTAAGHREQALEAFVEAARLYGGDYLQNALYEDWCDEPREALRRKYQDVLAFIATAHLEAGRPDMAEAYCRKLLAAEKTREDAHRLLMRILWSRGLREDAMKAYQSCCRILKDELDVAPLPETVDLHRRIAEGQPV